MFDLDLFIENVKNSPFAAALLTYFTLAVLTCMTNPEFDYRTCAQLGYIVLPALAVFFVMSAYNEDKLKQRNTKR